MYTHKIRFLYPNTGPVSVGFSIAIQTRCKKRTPHLTRKAVQLAKDAFNKYGAHTILENLSGVEGVTDLCVYAGFGELCEKHIITYVISKN